MNGNRECLDAEVSEVGGSSESASFDGAGCVAYDGGGLGPAAVKADEERHSVELVVVGIDRARSLKAERERGLHTSRSHMDKCIKACHVCYRPRLAHMGGRPRRLTGLCAFVKYVVGCMIANVVYIQVKLARSMHRMIEIVEFCEIKCLLRKFCYITLPKGSQT